MNHVIIPAQRGARAAPAIAVLPQSRATGTLSCPYAQKLGRFGTTPKPGSQNTRKNRLPLRRFPVPECQLFEEVGAVLKRLDAQNKLVLVVLTMQHHLQQVSAAGKHVVCKTVMMQTLAMGSDKIDVLAVLKLF